MKYLLGTVQSKINSSTKCFRSRSRLFLVVANLVAAVVCLLEHREFKLSNTVKKDKSFSSALSSSGIERSARAPEPVSKSNKEGRARRENADWKLAKRLRTDPAYNALEKVAERGFIDAYPYRYTALNLEKETLSRFQNLLLDRQIAQIAAREGSRFPDSPEVMLELRAIDERFKSLAVPLIGARNFSMNDRFEKTLFWQTQLQKLSDRFDGTVDALSPQQHEAIINVLADDDDITKVDSTIPRLLPVLKPAQARVFAEQMDALNAFRSMQSMMAKIDKADSTFK